MSEWQWFEDFERDALARGDAERARLRGLHREGFAHRETDPERAVALFLEGRRLAEQLGEPWWVLCFDLWYVQGRLYYQRDLRNLLDKAVQNSLQLRRPVF